MFHIGIQRRKIFYVFGWGYLRPSSNIQPHCSLVSSARCRQATNVSPFEPIFCISFLPRSELVNIFYGACPNCGYFSKRLFSVWKPEFNSAIFVINPVMFWRPYRLAPRAAALLARHLNSVFTSRNKRFVFRSHASSIRSNTFNPRISPLHRDC